MSTTFSLFSVKQMSREFDQFFFHKKSVRAIGTVHNVDRFTRPIFILGVINLNDDPKIRRFIELIFMLWVVKLVESISTTDEITHAIAGFWYTGFHIVTILFSPNLLDTTLLPL